MSASRAMRVIMTRPLAASFSLLLALLLVACDSSLATYRFGGYTMGTTYTVTLVDVDEALSDDLESKVAEYLVEINEVFSTYLSESELSRLNRHPLREPLAISEALFHVLSMSKAIHEHSGGAFDPTVMPLVNMWGFGPDRPSRLPDPDAIEAALAEVGFDGLVLDATRGTATRERDIRVDLSAIAKGYGVDLLAELLEKHGVRHYMVDIGGELRVKGHNPRGEPWRIAIESASGASSPATIVALTDRSIATSGDYRNYFEQDGKRFSHTIDPRSGYPIDHPVASVTVLAETAALADGWATALSVVGADEALMLADREDIAVFLLVKGPNGFESRFNNAFAVLLDTNGG